jgi:twitching motility protein PilI
VALENQNSESNRRPLLAPVAALTRCHPDISGLSNRNAERTEYIRQGVKVGATGIFLPYLEKVEIIALESLCPIPNTPMWFMGMINNRGNLLPVFDLKLFMQTDVAVPSRWLMILGSGGRAAGLCIDSLPVTIENPEQVDPARIDTEIRIPADLRPYLSGSFLHDGALWMDLTYDKLFLDLCARF